MEFVGCRDNNTAKRETVSVFVGQMWQILVEQVEKIALKLSRDKKIVNELADVLSSS